MNPTRKLILGTCCALVCVALAANAQYNTYDSDSNSDSDGGPILTNAELGKLVRGSGRPRSGAQLRNLHNQQQQLAASRNLYNKQQAALQYAPSQSNRRQYGGGDLSSYNPLSGAASGREQANNGDDDDEGSSMGPNFGANFDGESNADSADSERGAPMNLNQAASGYPAQGGDDAEQAGLGNFGGFGAAGYADGADFGPSSEGFGGEARRAKSASSLTGSRGLGEEDAGAPQYGPNSAINAGEADDEARAGYAPESSGDSNDDDD